MMAEASAVIEVVIIVMAEPRPSINGDMSSTIVMVEASASNRRSHTSSKWRSLGCNSNNSNDNNNVIITITLQCK